jgi:rhodanese-related sulfurtransferase
MRRIVIGALAVALLLSPGASVPVPAGTKARDVKVDEARALVEQGAGKTPIVILDVRTPGEVAEGRIAGAVNVDLQASDFERRLSAMDKSRTYLVYCRTGNRSRRAIDTMERLGFGSLYHMYEGVVGWQGKGFPLTKNLEPRA